MQVTERPVKFPEESKVLFRILPEMISCCRKCSERLDDIAVGVSDLLESEERGLGELFVVKTVMGGIIPDLEKALSDINMIKGDIDELIAKGLLKKDLDITKNINKLIDDILKMLSDLLNRTKENPFSEDTWRIISNTLVAPYTAVNHLCVQLEELYMMYHVDPPEVSELVDLGKVVGIGILALLIVGGILKYIPNSK